MLHFSVGIQFETIVIGAGDFGRPSCVPDESAVAMREHSHEP
jgi:hypothetical protein